MDEKILKSFFILSFLFFPLSILAVNSYDVIINEIAWMGTENSYNDEWIELYNNTDSLINLKGWILKATDETPEIELTGNIPPNGFYLLERTNDTSVPNIAANQIYKGTLENNGENLELYDNFGNLIDSVNCSSGWFAGDNSTKQTMERKDFQSLGNYPDDWITSKNPGGTPKNNIIVNQSKELIIENESRFQSESQIKSSKEKLELIIYPSGIIINEILPSPAGPDSQEEWIEIFNQNNFEVNISNWQIADKEGKINAYTIPQGTKISSQEFMVFSRPITKIILNNSGDSLNLIHPDKNVTDEMFYEKASQNQSYNKIDSQWFWSTTLTPGLKNVISLSTSKNEKTNPNKSAVRKQENIKKSTFSKDLQESRTQKELAFIGLFSQVSIFLTALGFAILSGIAILIFKRKIRKKL